MILGLALVAAVSGFQREVPSDRFQAMSMAITVHIVLGPRSGSLTQQQNSSVGEDDEAQLATAGFKSVRFAIDATDLTVDSSGNLADGPRQKLMEAIKDAQKAGLAVTLAPEKMGATEDAVCDFLTKFSDALSKTDPDKTYLEVDADAPAVSPDWQAMQMRRIAAVRTKLPKHSLLVTFGGDNALAEILKSSPLPDGDVVYGFRFFDPKIFTSQRLPGALIQAKDDVRLPYGLAESDAITMISNLDDRLRDPIMEYARGKWAYDPIERMIRPVGAWARSHRVWVLAEAFGVSQKVNPGDRSSYLHDVSSALTANGIGWCLSEYLGPYGVFAGPTGNRVADPGVLSSLGLSG